MYIDEHALVNKVFIDVNKISTVFGRDNFREYINRQVRDKNLVRIKNRSSQTSESNAPIARDYGKDASIDSIRNPNNSVKKNSARYQQNESAAQLLQQENDRMLEDVAALTPLTQALRKQNGGKLRTAY